MCNVALTRNVAAGGLPIGALLVKQHVADALKPGDHGSTFAGNPLVCHVAEAVVDIIAESSFLAAVEEKGERLRSSLRKALAENPHVKDVRGLGLICGIQLDQVCSLTHAILNQCRSNSHCSIGIHFNFIILV